MGTATLTRSQSRKTRPNCSLNSCEKVLSSPFVDLSGNNLDSSLRRRTRREVSSPKFVEKENAPPSSSRLAHGSERKGLAESSLLKVSKKRKQSEKASKGSGRSSTSAAVEATLETSMTEGGELSSHRPHVDGAENTVGSQPCPQIQVLSDNGLSLLERTCDPAEDQTELQSRCLNAKNSAQKKADGSLGQGLPSDLMRDQRKYVAGTKQISNDAGVRAVLPSSSALVLLQKDYERLFSRYKKLKAQKLDEADALFNEQNSRISDFVQASEALLESYKRENLSLKQQIAADSSSELLERCKSLEKANIDCRNELVQEQSKGLELRQENKRLKSLLLDHIADKQKQSIAEPVPFQGSQNRKNTDVARQARNESTSNGSAKLVHRLLECVLGLQLSCPDDGVEPHLHFYHRPTGFSFDIKEAHDKEVAELVEGGELLYRNVSVGVCRKAVIEWMKEKELIFGMNQVQMLLKRLVGVLNRGFY